MPGAFLKGNCSFPGSFIVDELSRSWDIFGTSNAFIKNANDFTNDSSCSVHYYKLKNIIFLSMYAVLKPSTKKYTGIENDTAYIYTGEFNFPEKIVTEVEIELRGELSASPFHFQNSLAVEDFKTGVFFEICSDAKLGFMHVNGLLDPTKLVLTLPSGFVPHHTYTLSGSLIYEVL